MAFYNLPLKRFNTIFIDNVFKQNITIKAKTYNSVTTVFPKNSGLINLSYSRSVIFEGTVHTFRSSRHMAYDPNTETYVDKSQLPGSKTIDNGVVVVHNDMLYFIKGRYQYQYNSNSNTWLTITSNLPFNFSGGDAVSYNGKIYLLTGHVMYKSDAQGTTWTSVSGYPYPNSTNFTKGRMIVHNNRIHVFGNNGGTTSKFHYKWDEIDGWDQVSVLPTETFNEDAITVYNDDIHLFIGNSSYETVTKRYKFNDATLQWYAYDTDIEGINVRTGSALVFNGELIIFGDVGGKSIKELYNLDITNNYLETGA